MNYVKIKPSVFCVGNNIYIQKCKTPINKIDLFGIKTEHNFVYSKQIFINSDKLI